PRTPYALRCARGDESPELTRKLAFVAEKSRRDRRDEDGRGKNAQQHDAGDQDREQCADRSRDAIGFLPFSARDERGIDGDERRRERALAKQVLQEVRDAERRVERIRGVRFEAEVVREDLQSNEAGEAAEEDARGDKNGAAGSAVRWFGGA